MSGAAGAAGAAAASAAAAAEQQRMIQEEEEMTTYGPDDLDGWEFKIIRAVTRKFRRPEELRRVMEEEARAGWELVEKFDDTRIRVKRRTEWREKDSLLDQDPYRVWVGTTPGKQVAIVVGVTVGVMVLLLTVLLLALT